MTRDSRGVSFTHASGNKQQTLVLAVVPAVAYEPAPIPLGHSSGSPGEHSIRQSSMTKRPFVGVQASSREVPAHHWRKKKKPTNLDALERVRKTIWLYLHHPFPKCHSSVPRETSWIYNPSCKEFRWVLTFPNYVGCCQGSLYLSLIPSRLQSSPLHDWGLGKDWESSW